MQWIYQISEGNESYAKFAEFSKCLAMSIYIFKLHATGLPFYQEQSNSRTFFF